MNQITLMIISAVATAVGIGGVMLLKYKRDNKRLEMKNGILSAEKDLAATKQTITEAKHEFEKQDKDYKSKLNTYIKLKHELDEKRRGK